MFNYDAYPNLLAAAKPLILQDRNKYEKVYGIIEEYVQEKNIIIGSSLSIVLLLGAEKNPEDYRYELWSTNALKDIYELSNRIAKLYQDTIDTPEPKLVMMKSVIPYSYYKLFVDNRLMVEMYNVKTSALKTINVKKLTVLSPENILIDVYRDLYSPNKAAEWEDLVKIESNIFRYFDRQYKNIINGGDEKRDYKSIAARILDTMIKNNKNYILIGEHAVRLLYKSSDRKLEIPEYKLPALLSVISSLHSNDVYLQLTQVLKELGVTGTLTFKTRGLDLVKDWRLTRTAFKLDGKEILYVYNSTEYELIPVVKVYKKIEGIMSKGSPYYIGNIFVISRFLLIELQTVYKLLHVNKIDEAYADVRIKLFIVICSNLRKFGLNRTGLLETLQSAQLTTESGILSIFTPKPEDYMGTYINENIAIKTHVNALYDVGEKKISDYFPQLEFKKNNAYRGIQ